MAFTIISQPANLNFCGNLPAFVLTSNAQIAFKLYQGAALILEERYAPDADGKISIDLEDVINGLLTVVIPNPANLVTAQTNAVKEFKAVFDATEVNFKVIKGGIGSGESTTDFLFANFLTWQTKLKAVSLNSPEWLSYYATLSSQLMVKAYLVDSSTQIKKVADLPAGQLSTVRVSYANVAALFPSQPFAIEFYIEQSGNKVSYVQRFQLSDAYYEYDDVFVFENSLGGIDTILFTGEIEHNESFKFDRGLFDNTTKDFQVSADQSFKKQTGYFNSEAQRCWSLEFFKSLQKFHAVYGSFKSVVLPKQTLDSVPGNLAGYSFTFAYAIQSNYTEVDRGELPEVVNEHKKIYYGASLAVPVTEAAILALPYSNPDTIVNLSFPTGSNKTFTIALPPGLQLQKVWDQQADEDLTLAYKSKAPILIDGVAFTILVMQNAMPYSTSHTHLITLTTI